ncbi:hypothetical protein DMC30DRAFT_413787 [Rhodotorula diobovata]|uniref:Uncharacterized protein n=1 Tax=Rhodotorula diobovata TaxID=5288 RepID=A0A5C5G6A5_9BASI|nr:hypothetical protein DMC30DRAFT_413787 [Rhodotorula diobovata]
MLTLEDLPFELLIHIHLLSLSHALPNVSRHLRSTFAATSPHHRARYLFLRHDHKPLSHAVKYPVCTLDVVHALERLARERGKKLKCSTLPRRLVKGLGKGSSKKDDDVDLPLITYLLDEYRVSPNSHDGYPLARAVFARHLPLVRLLLKYGADPALKDGWAVTTAIANGDADLVKLLMEREVEREDEDGPLQEVVLPREGGKSSKKRRRDSGGGGGKRRRMDDRCKATKEMLETAVKAKQWGIVDYLTAKGAPPSLNVLAML